MILQRRVWVWVILWLLSAAAAAQPFDPALLSGLRWRNVGPFRGGWGTCAEGIPDQPDTFYFGAAGGGVWKTEDAGRTWTPLFEHESASAVWALAIAPSNPKVLYVGTGQVDIRYDIASGDGVFRSDDGGRTWRHLGLSATRAVGRILVDPRNPDVAVVAALGHIFGPNRERGVFRTEDGGRTWSQTLSVNDETGAVDLARDPANPSVVYAAAWQARNYPWLSYFLPVGGPGSGIYKSGDGGRTWKRLTGGGWPEGSLGRIGLAVSPGGRVYALVDAESPVSSAWSPEGGSPRAGLYRSEDGGASWVRVSAEPGLANSYFGRLTPDPTNPDVIYAMGQSIRRSEDGGKSWRIVKGAPGGDDYHFLWINPKRPDRMITASDQGTIVTVNGGKTWSDWYNQPTGQFYHVETDGRFPYWIYSGQQDSGTVGISSRSDYGALSFREWHPVGGEERGWDVPDPEDPEIVYGTGLGGTVTRFDTRTGQVENVSPAVESTYAQRPTDIRYRFTWISPLAVSRKPPHALYFGSQYLFRSTDRGRRWETISPDLSGGVRGTEDCEGALTLEKARACGYGVIYTIALSPSDDREIWIGTDDGLVQQTRDGGRTWQNVTPKGLPIWSKVASLDVSALEPGTVYAAVDAHRLDDFSPHAYRTHDFGKTWTAITAGLPRTQFVNVVRADPVRRGLLYAGTDAGVFVSLDDGDHWQPLQLNLPTSWVRDLTVHGDDLIAATQGRAIWVLDGVTPLRQIERAVAAAPVHLFRPAPAIRLRRNENRDTPLPPETPLGENPPTGALIDYRLRTAAKGPVTLEILDSRGERVRVFRSDDPPEKFNAHRYFAEEWVRPPAPPSASAGAHRFVWDLRAPRPRAERYAYTIAAIHGQNTPVEPEGPLVLPGEYRVRLTVDGQTFAEPLPIRMDPRVRVSEEDLKKQFELAQRIAADMDRQFGALEGVQALRRQLAAAAKRAGGQAAERIRDLDRQAAELAGAEEGGREGKGKESLRRLGSQLSNLLRVVTGADAAPTAQAVGAFEELHATLGDALAHWEEMRRREIPAVNVELGKGAGLPAVSLEKREGAPPP